MPTQFAPPAPSFSEIQSLAIHIQELLMSVNIPGLCSIIISRIGWCLIYHRNDFQKLRVPLGTGRPTNESIFLGKVFPCPPCLSQVPECKNFCASSWLQKNLWKTNGAIHRINTAAFRNISNSCLLHMRTSVSNITIVQLGNCMSAFKSRESTDAVLSSMFLVCCKKIFIKTAAILSCQGWGLYRKG